MRIGSRRRIRGPAAFCSAMILIPALTAWPVVSAVAESPITEYVVGSAQDRSEGIAYGPDGNIWVAQRDGNRIDRVTPDGVVTPFPLPNGGNPARIVAGPDGALWFTETTGNRIGRITVEGEVTELRVPTNHSYPTGITRQGDALWFTEAKAGKVARIDLPPSDEQGHTSGSSYPKITEFDVGKDSSPQEITAGPDGDVWFTLSGSNRIGRIVDGRLKLTRVPTYGSGLAGIAPAPDGSGVWFAETLADQVGLIASATPDVVAEHPIRVEGVDRVGPTMLTAGPDGGMWITGTAANLILRMDADGSGFRSFEVPTENAKPFGITVGPGNDLWFTERGTGKVGRIPPPERSPSVSDLTLTAQPATAAAGHQRTLPAALPADALADTAVLQSSPLRATPLRATPLRATPLRATPLRATPLRATGLAPIQLSAIPLRATNWSDVLAGTVYEGVPLQTVTLADVFALDPPLPAVQVLTLADIDLAQTPLRATSLAALLLSGVPLADLPDPASANWCDHLADQPLHCGNGADPATTTLLDLELGGDDLSAYYAQQIDLTRTDLSGTGAPIAAIRLVDFTLSRTPLGPLPTGAVPDLVTCEPAACPTLADAQAARGLDPDATVETVLDLLPAGGLDELGLGALLAGLVDGTEIAYEDGPLATVVDHAEFRTDDLVRYTAEFAVRCHDVAGLEVALTFAAGFRMVPGSGAVDITGGEPEAIPVPDAELDGGVLRLRPPTGEDGICGGAAPDDVVTPRLTLDVEPGTTLATFRASAAASTSTDRSAGLEVSTTATAPVTVDDGHDPGADEQTARAIAPDVLHTGHLSHVADVDMYALPAPAQGSTLRISLSHLPADYDLVVYGPSAEIPSTPLRATPLRATPLRATPLDDGSEQAASDDAELAPNGLQDVPLRATPLRATSIRRGTATESVTIPVRESDRDGTFLIQVSGYNGAHHVTPYVLRTAVEPGAEPLQCRPRQLTGGGDAGDFPALPLPVTTKTLVLVDAKRMGDLYGTAESGAMLNALQAYAARPEVAGVVVPVESDPDAEVSEAVAAWDADPCSVARANDVVGEVNSVVDHVRVGMTELRSIVLVGPDDALPMGRVPDLTTVANEKGYLDASIGGQDTSVSRALRSGFVLSDDPYGDFDPQVWLNGRLYVPDVALGRLVESPAEISAQLDAYATAEGVLAPDSAAVFGYDFLADGAEAVGAALAGRVPTTTRTDSDWTSADALAVLNRSEPGYLAVNAHYDHFRALPARSFTDDSVADLLTSSEMTPAAGSVLFTMGCHAGLNLPDIAVSTPSPTEAEQLLDWTQASTGRSALFAGNTGYGYGDTDAVAYSERLMAHYAAGLGGEVTAGQALLFAKQRHVGDLGVVGVYDAKVSQQTVFYGLPTYRIGPDGGEGEPALPEPPRDEPADPTLRTASFSIDPQTERVDTDRGSYWTVPGQQPQVTHFRPIEPRLSVDVTADDGLPVHGAVVEAQTSTDVDGVDPVYSQPTIDLSATEPERQASSTAFPAHVQQVNATASQGGRRDTLVLMPGQTFTDEEQQATQRLFGHLAGTVYRSDSNDWTPPTVIRVGGVVVAGSATFSVRTADTDVMRGIVLYRDDASDAWQTVELQHLGGGHWSAGAVLADGATRVTEFDVQLVDHAGNVGVSTNKGRHHVGEPASSSSDGVVITVSPEPPDDGFYQSSPQVTIEGLQEGESATVTIDGGPPFRYDGPFTIQGDGVHVVVATSDSGGTAVTFVAIDSSPPVVSGTVTPSPNEAGWHNQPVTVHFTCTDAVSGIAICPADTVLDDDGAGLSVTGSATDRAGNSASETVDGISIDQIAPTGTIEPGPLGFVYLHGPLTGSAADGLSGVTSVEVTYKPVVIGRHLQVEAELSCVRRRPFLHLVGAVATARRLRGDGPDH